MTRKSANKRQAVDPRFDPRPDQCGGEADLVWVGRRVSSTVPDAYGRELLRIERIQSQIDAMEDACQAYLHGSVELLQPLRERQVQAQRTLVIRLSNGLETESEALSRTQRATARQILGQLAQRLAEQGDAEMAALHDEYSSQTLAEKRQAAADALRERLAEWLSPDNEQAHSATQPEALLAAAREQWRAQARAQQEQREARQARRAARKATREPTLAALQDAQAEQEAGTTLRSIFRRLASALHPDRAPDETERARMNALMSEANAAYARKDLLALLKLQGQAEQARVPQQGLSSAQRMQALVHLLKQQAAGLERERQHAQQQWWLRLKLEPGSSLAEHQLQRLLESQRVALLNDAQQFEAAVAQTANLSGLKIWLNALSSDKRSI